MGYNKVLLLLNDADHEVTNDPAGWWQACRNAFFKLGRKPIDNTTYVKQPESFGHGGYVNAWEAVWEAHADNVAVILAGGNCATVLGVSAFSGGAHHTEELQIKILKEVLERKGYNVVKRASKPKIA